MPAAAIVLRHIRHMIGASAVDGQPDRELLRRFTRGGDGQAFAALLRRHGPMAWAACRRVLPCADDAEDVLQKTFLLLAQKAARLRDHDAVGGWLYGVAYRLALRARSAAVVRADRESRTPPRAPPDPLADITRRETQQVFDEALARLPEKYRAVLVLCCLEGRTQDQAARQLGCSLSTLKRRLEEGRTRLSQQLVRHGLTLPAAALAAMLAPRANAALPPVLTAAVLRAVAGVPVAGLGGRAVGGLLAGKFRLSVAAAAIAVALAAGGVAFWITGILGGKPGSAGASADDGHPPRVDHFGDPLPHGAVARIGTTHFRHAGPIKLVAFAADGKRLLSCGDDGIRVWDVATGREQRRLVAEPGTPFGCVALSSDGKLAATTRFDESVTARGAVTLWDLTTGKKVKELGHGHRADKPALSFTPDGQVLAVAVPAGADGGTVETWDVATGRQLTSWKAANRLGLDIRLRLDTGMPAAFTGDGKTLMTSGRPGEDNLYFWEAATGEKLRRLDDILPRGSTVCALALSADDKMIALASENPPSRICILDAADGKVLRQVEVPATNAPFFVRNSTGRGARHVAFSPDGKVLAGAWPNSFVYLWDVATGKELHRLAAFAPTHMAFSPDGTTLAVATVGNAIRLYDIASGKELLRGAGPDQPAYSIALTPDGRTLATTSEPFSIGLWDPATGEQRRRLEVHERCVKDLLFSPDGRTLFSSDDSFMIFLPEDPLHNFFSDDGSLRVWDVATGRQLQKFAGGDLAGTHWPLACAPDGKRLAVWTRKPTSPDGVLQVIDTTTGKRVHEYLREVDLPRPGWRLRPDGYGSVHGATFLHDGRSLVLCIGNKSHWWDVTTGEYIGQNDIPLGQYGRRWGFPNVAFSPDGRRIASAFNRPGANGWIAVHELAGSAEVFRYATPAACHCLALSPDGRTIAWGSRTDSLVHLLDVATGKERHAFDGHGGGIVSLTFSADGKTLVSGGTDTTLLVWDLAAP
jgi:RNA polymerase sigma factor (sigma-70 family)